LLEKIATHALLVAKKVAQLTKKFVFSFLGLMLDTFKLKGRLEMVIERLQWVSSQWSALVSRAL
jgi:hypothetical protein